MKTKYYSEITGKYYDSEKECKKAEKEFEQRKGNVTVEENKEKSLSIQKKELAQKIESADEKIAEANSEYKIAREEANKILEEAKEKAQKILVEASNKIRIAEEDKVKAVKEFNNKFGTYNVVYTGAKATEELAKTIDRFDRLFRNLFWF